MADKGCKARLLSYAQIGLGKVKEEKALAPKDARRCREPLDEAASRWKEAKRNIRKGPCTPAVDNVLTGYFYWREYEDCAGK